MVQSYTKSTVLRNSCRQNRSPVLRGKSWCCKSSMLCFTAHLLLLSLVQGARLVPSGNSINHIGLDALFKFCRWFARQALSISHFRFRNINWENCIPQPRSGIFFRDSFKTMYTWPCMPAVYPIHHK